MAQRITSDCSFLLGGWWCCSDNAIFLKEWSERWECSIWNKSKYSSCWYVSCRSSRRTRMPDYRINILIIQQLGVLQTYMAVIQVDCHYGCNLILAVLFLAPGKQQWWKFPENLACHPWVPQNTCIMKRCTCFLLLFNSWRWWPQYLFPSLNLGNQ